MAEEMGFLKKYSLFCYNLLGKYLKDYEYLFTDIDNDLQRSRVNAILPEYISTAILTSVISFFAFLPLLHVLLTLVTGPAFNLVALALIVVFASLVLSASVFVVFYYAPTFILSEKKRSIDGALPYASAHMATVAGTGAPNISMFKVLANFKEFGELSNECGDILRDVDLLGYDLLTAIERTARRTPSEKFRDLLWGIITTVRSGGDLRVYLVLESNSLLDDHRQKIREFINTVSLFSEVYTTIMIAAPLLVVIMVATMSVIGGASLPVSPAMLMVLTIYVFVPVGSLFSILYLKGAKPLEL